MLRTIRSHATYANVMATVAVFAAMSGTSYAAVKLSKDSVRTSHIKNGQVRGPDLAGGAVGARQVADGSLGVNEMKKDDVADLQRQAVRVVRLRGHTGVGGSPLEFDGRFTQKANEVVEILGQATATSSGSCFVWVVISVDGYDVLSGGGRVNSGTPQAFSLTPEDSEDATRWFEPGTDTPHELTASVEGECETGQYEVTELAVDVLGYR